MIEPPDCPPLCPSTGHPHSGAPHCSDGPIAGVPGHVRARPGGAPLGPSRNPGLLRGRRARNEAVHLHRPSRAPPGRRGGALGTRRRVRPAAPQGGVRERLAAAAVGEQRLPHIALGAPPLAPQAQAQRGPVHPPAPERAGPARVEGMRRCGSRSGHRAVYVSEARLMELHCARCPDPSPLVPGCPRPTAAAPCFRTLRGHGVCASGGFVMRVARAHTPLSRHGHPVFPPLY